MRDFSLGWLGRELIPLGTNGFFPTGGRQTMTFLILEEETALLLDAGTGMARLLEEKLRPRLLTYDRLEILLTHYHLDHVVGLSYLPAVWKEGPVRIHAPGPPLVDGDADALERLVGPPLFPKELQDLPFPVEIRSYATDTLDLAGEPTRFRRQDHSGGSVGVRRRSLAYCTDCRVDEGSTHFVRGVDLLLHEVWVTEGEAAAGDPRDGHSTVEEVAEVARTAGVSRLLPIHHRPGRSDHELLAMRRRLEELSGAEVLEGREGAPIELD
ncbi:MAG: MBL fold metallo-hydrolase [Thermoanaerobaculia bacterium]|nr:MBL fold metallo-hydrolase [Thermoanaerobaculia bacterium]